MGSGKEAQFATRVDEIWGCWSLINHYVHMGIDEYIDWTDNEDLESLWKDNLGWVCILSHGIVINITLSSLTA